MKAPGLRELMEKGLDPVSVNDQLVMFAGFRFPIVPSVVIVPVTWSEAIA
jgi:hypothetical protein